LGNVKTAVLEVKEGAVIDGTCQMSGNDKGEYTAAEMDE